MALSEIKESFCLSANKGVHVSEDNMCITGCFFMGADREVVVTWSPDLESKDDKYLDRGVSLRRKTITRCMFVA